MAERSASGIEIAEESGPDHGIARASTGVTAFIGRALRGPVNRPREIHSFHEFTQIFGGLWQPSTMSYAVEQFFENGGRTALVVRVMNGGRPPSLTLAAGTQTMRLVGLAPGSREYLRASVDYDGIGVNEPERFNLVVQRVRAPGSELIEDQEIFRRLSILEDSERYVAEVLAESRLVRLIGPVPHHRPERSPASPGSAVIGYVDSNPDGDDGAALTDYDVIGSAIDGTGLFALQAMPNFSLLCIPPLARDRDVGLPVLLVAARVCSQHHAMLVVDPPSDWDTVEDALSKAREWPFRSDHAVMYFPRVLAFDRLRGRFEVFGSSGAVAGMIARSDETWPVWAAAQREETILRPGLRPACIVTEAERVRLAQVGINALQSVRASARLGLSPRTLAAAGSGSADAKNLAVRRLALFIVASIERGTLWMIFERNAPYTWQRASAQVTAFLDALDAEGAFAGRSSEESYFVVCDERLNGPEVRARGRVCVLFGFAPTRAGDFHAYLVSHHAGASDVRAVSVNRLAIAGRRVEEEIETGILRGLTAEI
ncbi:MAG TPA: hypothetical protein VF315_03740 [Steroidobacteraceae bacterium]